MKISENLRARAAYIKRHGFSPFLGDAAGACCFIGSGSFPRGRERTRDDAIDDWLALEFLRDHILGGVAVVFASSTLEDGDWTTRDAVAALEMAADIAECEGL